MRDGGSRARVKPAATIVHGDWAPNNVVWRDGAIVGVIDWDLARPGDPLDDLAFAAWLWAPLHHPGMIAGGEFGPWEDAERERRLRLRPRYAMDSRTARDSWNGSWRACTRAPTASSVQRRHGDEGMIRLRSLGVTDDVRRSARWAEAHAGQLTAVLMS